MTLSQLAGKAQAPLALAGVLSIFAAMFVGLPKVGQLAWADDIARLQVAQQAEQTSAQNQTNARLNAIALTQLRAELRDTRRMQCQAIADNDAQRKQTYAKVMEELRDQYIVLRGQPWDEPDCEAL